MVDMALSVDVIPNRSSPPAILLREAWREGKRIRRRTLVNLSKAPPGLVDAVRAWLKGGVVYSAIDDAVSIRRALPHGAVAAVLGTARHLGLERMLHRSRSRMRDLALAAIAARILAPSSKLATARQLSPDTATSSLGPLLDLGEVSGNEMLEMLDWLSSRQPWIEGSLARRHLSGGTLILYDVSSSYMEGRQCPLAEFGHSRDGKRGKRQITYGLLCAEDGCPVAIEVFSGNTADPQTVVSQVQKIQARFGIEKVALAGDRGMITTARIREDLAPAGLDWISALKSQDIRKLARGAPPVLVLEALVPDAVAEIASPDFSRERLMVCLNPRLRAERARKREELLVATEEVLSGIAAAHGRGKPGAAARARTWKAIGRKANRKNVERHFDITVTDGEMVWARSEERINAEARLDGIWVVRTSLGAGAIGAEAAVEAYKRLSTVERAFRMAKSDLAIRPIHVYTATHVRAHVFLCMLALYVEWHMRRRLAPLLFQDDEKEGAREERASPVAPARVSASAKSRADSKLTADGLPVHSFRTLMEDLATLTLNEVSLPGNPELALPLLAVPTQLQNRAFELLNIDPARMLPCI
ncbi:IS1634 family transposase [Candidatus Poriferisocius sp.]|uniref:IS1634 family transposase n=1 Tax=Candidatus Poriferisocius sp. TaxID=3101276 RepID=UPI003B51ABCA